MPPLFFLKGEKFDDHGKAEKGSRIDFCTVGDTALTTLKVKAQWIERIMSKVRLNCPPVLWREI